MNKYRISNHLDYYTELTCLKCKKISIYDYNSDREVYNYCPFCGTKWDGVFDTVNKRYKTQKDILINYKSKNGLIYYADKPRIILEGIKILNKKLSSFSFAVEECEPYIQRILLAHYEVGNIGNFIQQYKHNIKNHYNLYNRIILYLLDKSKATIIKEHFIKD